MNNKFWKWYWIVFASVLAIGAVLLFVFYDVMKYYEQSQPTTAAQQYAGSVTDADMETWIDQAMVSHNAYETEEMISSLLDTAMDGKEISVSKDFTSYSSERPVFFLSFGEITFARIVLEKNGNLRYGFTNWDVVETKGVIKNSNPAKTSFLVYAPTEANLQINGIEVTEEPDRVVSYPFHSTWETEAFLKSDCYLFESFLDKPDFSCEFDGIPCEVKADGNKIYFLYPEEYLLNYTIKAPEGAQVFVNDIPLGDEHITEKEKMPTEYIEEGKEGIPGVNVYSLMGLTSVPKVKGEYLGEELRVDFDGSKFTVQYPESSMYSCTVRVPSGSTVVINRKQCTTETIASSEEENKELFAHCAKTPSYDIYRFENLYLQPKEITASYRGLALELDVSVEGNDYSASATFPKINDANAENATLAFVRDYLTYTAQGYMNLKENLYRVLGHIPSSSALYWKILQTESGFSFTSPAYNMKYDKLELTNVYSYPDGLMLCDVDFDVLLSYYGNIDRRYNGIFRLVLTRDYKIVGMEIISDE